ncbi:hypothetical protein JXL21_02090 [Candidatus Bathyarchaeota archaeon]|nr:hypothetical protein [Candidatus Bathyarchaeota archaeon]
MPTETQNRVHWLQSRHDAILAEIEQQIEEISDPHARDALNSLVELNKVSLQLQALGFVNILSRIAENQLAVDDELLQISEYVDAIVSVHMEEAANLEKVL